MWEAMGSIPIRDSEFFFVPCVIVEKDHLHCTEFLRKSVYYSTLTVRSKMYLHITVWYHSKSYNEGLLVFLLAPDLTEEDPEPNDGQMFVA